MITRNDFKIDPRSPEDIRAEFAELAASYTPEWAFDTKNPDVGSVIGMLFIEQMAGGIDRLNQVTDKYRTEFVNMLNIGLSPASTAYGAAVIEVVRDTVPGLDIPAGTRLLGYGDGDSALVFETLSDLHATHSRLCDILALSGRFGKIIPLLGESEEEDGSVSPISLFDYSGEGVQQNALVLCHQSVFDVQPEAGILVRVLSASGENISACLADAAKYAWSYYDGQGFAAFEEAAEQDGVICLSGGQPGKSTEEGDEAAFAMVRVDALGAVEEAVGIGSLEISSGASGLPPAFICHNDSELETGTFLPFGETASLFDECYIGNDLVFSHGGAAVTLRFHLDFQEKLVTFTPEEIDETLRIIKRKPRKIMFSTAHTEVERVSFEYFNGEGWRRLVCAGDCSALFGGEVRGEAEIAFDCPDDWQPLTVGGNTGRSIRMRVAQADNCYLQPCIHSMPRISGLAISYAYEGQWRMPQRLQRMHGALVSDCTDDLLSGRGLTAFAPLPYPENAVCLGFDHKIEGAPTGIFFEIAGRAHSSGANIRYEYSTERGFARMRVRDDTAGLSKSGGIWFALGEDFAPMDIEGKRRHWIRLVDEDGAFNQPGRRHPHVTNILLNAVSVRNTQTMEEEAFYIDEALPNMSFALQAGNILFAEVFVNERQMPRHLMEKMLAEQPDDVRAEYDARGGVTDFYVRWGEVENFDLVGPQSRCYCIDRMTNRIHFGDGKNVKIPSVLNGPAFTVRLFCCDGAAGNLPPEAVSGVAGNILYVNRVYNPAATGAGSDIESVWQAHERGANMLNTRGRLVSEMDFLREVQAFSGMVGQARCVAGRDMEGKQDSRLVSIAVLMRDYADGPYSFSSIKENLKKHLLEQCEATLSADALAIFEPIFAEISVDVWIRGADTQKSMETAAMIKTHIRAFLEPVPPQGAGGVYGAGAGWRIGETPTFAQIGAMLHNIGGAVIGRFAVSARYTDRSGTHEQEIDALRGQPFVIGVNGEHRVHLMS
ncbi:MAG: hypothetical protein LBT26_08685 [Clostridiales Family XIII bacterium]|jgi:hypothetical protein|nr:hypothetical protein [Clostridiales Family XIII bacterium]